MRAAITAQGMEVLAILDFSEISNADKRTVRRNAEAVLDVLGKQAAPGPGPPSTRRRGLSGMRLSWVC